MDTLQDRVAYLIRAFHANSVKAAAGRYGLAQPTLSRIKNGKIRNPGVDVLRRIADYHATTLDWLANGIGEAPMPQGPEGLEQDDQAMAAYTKYVNVVRPLVTSAETSQLFKALPQSNAAAWITPPMPADLSDKKRRELASAVQSTAITAIGANAAMLASVFEHVIETLGADRAAAGFEANVGNLCLLDTSFVLWLQHMEFLPSDILPLFRDYIAFSQLAPEQQSQIRSPQQAKGEASHGKRKAAKREQAS